MGRGNEGQLAEQSRQSQLIDVFVRGINVCGGPLQKKDARLSPVNVRVTAVSCLCPTDGLAQPLPVVRGAEQVHDEVKRRAKAQALRRSATICTPTFSCILTMHVR